VSNHCTIEFLFDLAEKFGRSWQRCLWFLKRQSQEIFDLWFFPQSTAPLNKLHRINWLWVWVESSVIYLTRRHATLRRVMLPCFKTSRRATTSILSKFQFKKTLCSLQYAKLTLYSSIQYMQRRKDSVHCVALSGVNTYYSRISLWIGTEFENTQRYTVLYE
jgi:hypothetical protein